MKPIFDRKIDFHAILGNHDTFYKDTNVHNSLNKLYPSDKFPIKTYVDPTEVTIKGINFLMLPWICADNYDRSLEFARNSNAEIVISHLELSGFEMDRGNINHSGMDKSLFDRFPRVYSGHYHHKSSIENITYLGAPCQYSWIDYDDPKGFHILDTKTKDLTFIRNPYELFKKFIYDDTTRSTPEEMLAFNENIFSGTYTKIIVKKKNDPYLLDLVMAKIDNAAPADLQVVEEYMDIDAFQMSDIDMEENQDTISLLKKYINSSDSTADKKKIEQFMSDLYIEAMNLET